jgi:hypothetical protein
LFCLKVRRSSQSHHHPGQGAQLGQHVAARQPVQHRQQTSRDILRLNQHQIPLQEQTAEVEVDRYLNDAVVHPNMSSLEFWQV